MELRSTYYQIFDSDNPGGLMIRFDFVAGKTSLAEHTLVSALRDLAASAEGVGSVKVVKFSTTETDVTPSGD